MVGSSLEHDLDSRTVFHRRGECQFFLYMGGRVEEWRHTRRSGLSVALRFLWECLTNRTV